jgi:hypothetical protein
MTGRAASSPARRGAASPRGPDIALFMTDQQRYDQVGYASGGFFETPALDRLAARGVRFDAAYSASTTCVPARNALLTGIQPHRLPKSQYPMALAEGTWTVAHALQQSGYDLDDDADESVNLAGDPSRRLEEDDLGELLRGTFARSRFDLPTLAPPASSASAPAG